MQVKKPNIHFYMVNGIALITYIVVLCNLALTNLGATMFASPDAQTYLDVANWIESGTGGESLYIRPVLYPIIILFASKLAGLNGIWLLQVLFWLVSINFTFATIKILTKNNFYAYLGSAVLISNLSLISITLHALTEVTTVFLLSWLLWFIAKNKAKYKEVFFIHTCLFFLVLLTVVKPLFSVLVFFTLFVVLPLFYFKKYLKTRTRLIVLLLLLLPLLTQLTIMKVKYNEFKVSYIGSETLKYYFLTQGVQVIEGVDYIKAEEKAIELSQNNRDANYILEHKKAFGYLFLATVKNNITGKPYFLTYPQGQDNPTLHAYMLVVNKVYLFLHCFFFLPILFLLYLLFTKKEYDNLIAFLVLSSLSYYFLATSGISFFQGDRLVLPAIAIWVCLYTYVTYRCVSLFQAKKKGLL